MPKAVIPATAKTDVIPAKAETDFIPAKAETDVIPAKAGIQGIACKFRDWIPAFAGMTDF